MGIFDRLFGKKKDETPKVSGEVFSAEEVVEAVKEDEGRRKDYHHGKDSPPYSSDGSRGY